MIGLPFFLHKGRLTKKKGIMATYFPTSNDAAPMLYPRESLPSSYSEAPILSSNMMMYMDYPSSSGPCNIVGSHHGEQDFGSWGNNRNEMSFLPPMGEASYILQGVQNWHGEGLSLGRNTQIPSALQLNSVEYQNPNSAFSSFSSPCASLTTYDDENSPNKQLRNSESLKMDISPYGMSSISRTILNSRYLKATQQLLDEVVNVKKATKQWDGKKDSVKSFKEVDGKLNVETTLPTANGSNSTKELSAAEKQDLENKLAKLLSLLDEVDRRYRRYYHQMQIVVTSFDAISGNGAANSYTSLALQTISRHFRCLRDAITGQIKATRGSLGEEEDGAASNSKGVGISRLRYLDQHLRQQRAIQQLGMMQQHAWRPQRGLPESSVSILRAWLFEHFLHPYPKDSEKIILARQAGLTRSQVSNWFINARVRLWKPMVEDMYKEEIGDAEMDSNSSSEVAPKATTSGIRASEDGGEDLKPSATSKATEQSSIIQNIEMAGITSDATFQSGIHRGAETEYGLVKSRGEQRFGVDESSLFPYTIVQSNGGSGRFPATAAAAYHHTWELGRLGNGSGVSLTLGLQHCEGGFVTMRDDGLYNAASPSAGPEAAADFEHRFGSSHLLHDFVG